MAPKFYRAGLSLLLLSIIATGAFAQCKVVVNFAGSENSVTRCGSYMACGSPTITCDSCYEFYLTFTDTGCCADSIIITDDGRNPTACFNVCNGGGGTGGKGACDNNPETYIHPSFPLCPSLGGLAGPPILLCRDALPGLTEYFDFTIYCSCGTQEVTVSTGH